MIKPPNRTCLETEFALRAATPNDAAGVTAVLTAAYSELLKPDYDPAVLALALPKMTNANPKLLASGTYYVQETEAGQIAACGGWTHEEPGTIKIETGVAHLRHFATHPDWTGHGLARAIVERCRSDMLAVGVRRISCFSTLSAEAFYAPLGFVTVKRIDVTMSGGVSLPSVLMVLELGQAQVD